MKKYGVVALLLGVACNSSSNGGSTPGHDGGGSGGNGSDASIAGGGQTCTVNNPAQAEDVCYTIVEGETCTGTLGNAPCPNLFGCCVQVAQTMCWLNEVDSPGPILGPVSCAGTWVMPDGGSSPSGDDSGPGGDDGGPGGGDSGGNPFIGTWTGDITIVAACGDASATTTSRSDTLDIAAGPSAGTLSVTTTSNGCVFVYSVSGDTATAQAGQVCDEKGKDGGVDETLSVNGRTLTYSDTGGPALSSTGSSTTVKGATTCNDQESGTYSP
jgi:hypothetical protein